MNTRRKCSMPVSFIFAGALFLLMFDGCSVSHQTMRGFVVGKDDKEADICIGAADGLKVGDMIAVYRTRRVGVSNLPEEHGPPYYGPSERARSYRYEKIRVGTARVVRLFDEHFAAVEVVKGEIDFPDIVEKTLVP